MAYFWKMRICLSEADIFTRWVDYGGEWIRVGGHSLLEQAVEQEARSSGCATVDRNLARYSTHAC